MVERKEVVWIRLPFPSVSDKLARISHMYICLDRKDDDHWFAKVQTDKPSARIHMTDFIPEPADKNRNPFRQNSLIDCDKRFLIEDCAISPDAYPVDGRKDVCDDLFDEVSKLIKGKPIENINVDTVHTVDKRITRASTNTNVT